MNHAPHENSPDNSIKDQVRQSYARIASSSSSCCAPGCTDDHLGSLNPAAQAALIGYAPEQLAQSPSQANLGLGCGNPIDRAGLMPGETVLDLGSGPGFDALLAAQKVGAHGMVIGVDMTSEMIDRARANAKESDVTNVRFELAEIEKLPLADASVDVAVSNCVINLSPDKPAVYRELFRVLRPGGRICISDVLLEKDIPESLKKDPAAWCGWISGASLAGQVRPMLEAAGFADVQVEIKPQSKDIIASWKIADAENYAVSAYILASKP